MDYKIVIKEDSNGLWEAHKVYTNGESGVAFMFAPTEDCLKFKLEEDGEDAETIYVKSKKELDKLTDRELVSWAVQHGWTYWHSNDQLRDPRGGFTTAHNWDNIGQYRREQIISQMLEE